MTTTRNPSHPGLASVFHNELAAVEAYQSAMAQLERVPLPVAAAHDSHLHRCSEIRNRMGDLGADHGRDHDSGEGWRYLAPTAGDRSTIDQLARCEEETERAYRRLSALRGLDDTTRAYLEGLLLPEQRTTRAALAALALSEP